jgi:hypothetical protein
MSQQSDCCLERREPDEVRGIEQRNPSYEQAFYAPHRMVHSSAKGNRPDTQSTMLGI